MVQEVFIKLFSNWDDLGHTGIQLRAWLFRVTHNEAVDLVRSEERRKNREAVYSQEYHAERAMSISSDNRNERMKEVLRCVRSLPDSSQRVVLLRLQQGMAYEEISDITGYAVGTCRNLLSQAVRQLADMVDSTGGADV
ncbi:MAG: sigma-70 family RNA polymerase sigma factor [Kiritimatiellia bacterium]